MKVLLVEDHPLVAEIVQTALEEGLHATVTRVGTAREGVEALRAVAPDLAVIDIILPEITGLLVAQSATTAIRMGSLAW